MSKLIIRPIVDTTEQLIENYVIRFRSIVDGIERHSLLSQFYEEIEVSEEIILWKAH